MGTSQHQERGSEPGRPIAVRIRPMRPADRAAVLAIYAAGIATGSATFETAAPTWDAWDASHLPSLRLVAAGPGDVVGWAAASPVSDRGCYAGVVEDSVYVSPGHRGARHRPAAPAAPPG